MPCFNQRLRLLRDEAGLSQQELANQTGITKSSINMYERGEREPGLETLETFADYFNVDMNYLIGYQFQKHIPQIVGITLTTHEREVITAYRDKPDVQPKVDELLEIAPEKVLPFPDDPVKLVPLKELIRIGGKIPVLGRVPAGVPIEAVTDVIDELDIPPEWVSDDHGYFALKVKGRSMYPDYLDGDYVIIRQQPTAESGEDVVAYIGDDDATLKRLHRNFNGIELRPVNDAYQTLTYTNKQIQELPITIAGIVVETRRAKKRK